MIVSWYPIPLPASPILQKCAQLLMKPKFFSWANSGVMRFFVWFSHSTSHTPLPSLITTGYEDTHVMGIPKSFLKHGCRSLQTDLSENSVPLKSFGWSWCSPSFPIKNCHLGVLPHFQTQMAQLRCSIVGFQTTNQLTARNDLLLDLRAHSKTGPWFMALGLMYHPGNQTWHWEIYGNLL